MRTYAFIRAQIEKLEAEAAELLVTERVGVIVRMQEAIDVYGITENELYGVTEYGGKKKPTIKKKSKPTIPMKAKLQRRRIPPVPKGSKHPPRYADKKGNTWAGGGSTPNWLKVELMSGKEPDDFLIAGQKHVPRFTPTPMHDLH